MGCSISHTLNIFGEVLAKTSGVSVDLELSSSNTGCGTGSLRRDAEEISMAVYYFRYNDNGGHRKRIVLMGHSARCQDITGPLSVRPGFPRRWSDSASSPIWSKGICPLIWRRGPQGHIGQNPALGSGQPPSDVVP